MATLPFMAAKTAKEQGHEVVLWLWNEAVTLSRKGTVDHIYGVNLTPLKELMTVVQAAGVQILGVRRLCRGSTDHGRGSSDGCINKRDAGLYQGCSRT